MMLKFLVKGQKIEILEREVIASDQIAFVTLKFVFDGDWKKFHKVVQFTQCDETYNRVLCTDGLSCLLPAELHAGAVKLSVFGYDADNTSGLRATTVPVTLHIRASGFERMPILPFRRRLICIHSFYRKSVKCSMGKMVQTARMEKTAYLHMNLLWRMVLQGHLQSGLLLSKGKTAKMAWMGKTV